jgi:hypothetical protein
MPWNVFFYCWYLERENIYGRIRNWIRNFLLVNEDPDPNPDPKKIVSDPQHWKLEWNLFVEPLLLGTQVVISYSVEWK